MIITDILIVFLISMVPLIELRGAIPVAVGMGLGLPEWAVLLIAICGNLVPIPLIYLFARKFLEWGKDQKWKKFAKFCDFCLTRGEKAGKKLMKKTRGGIYPALFMFVAIPIPGTGAWTGTLAASLLKLDFKRTMVAISAGVMVAGLIMLLVSLGVFRAIIGG